MADSVGSVAPSGLGIRCILRETVLGFVYWSIYQAVAPLIWFYPLNELEISGYEAFALVKLSPLLLGVYPLRLLLRRPWVMFAQRIAIVGCLASFQAPSTLQRLIILCAGCFFLQIVWTASLCSGSIQQRTLTFWGMMMGYFAYLSSRVWFGSFVPTWWSKQTNSIVIALAAIATLDKILSGDDKVGGGIKLPKASDRPNWVLSAVGLSTLIFVTHFLFGEVSVITRWVVQGYPNTGPMPMPWGALVLLALFAGSRVHHGVATTFYWWVYGAGCFAALLYLPAWQGFTGGLGLAVYTMSLWPQMIERVVRCPPGRTVALAAVLHIVLLLFSVWTTAYNFVPGGEYTREHTDWLVGYLVLSLGVATLTGRDKIKEPIVTFVKIKGKRVHEGNVSRMVLILVLVGLGGFVARYNPAKYEHPQIAHPKADFTAAIWTYHFGYDNQGWPSLERSAAMLADTGADFITLLESDASKPFLGNHDLGQWLGERLGMYVDFGVSTRDHTWGNLILSKYPIVKSTPHMLPSPHGELAPAITATINMTGHLVDFVVTHMGNDQDWLDRKLQSQKLASELRRAENPVVFLGYVTSAPGSEAYRTLLNDGKVKDIDPTDKDRWCEYIMYRGLKRLGYGRVSHGGLSDTEVQMARFRIPQDPANFVDNTRFTNGHAQADPDVLFTRKFGDYHIGHNWVHVHQYHMKTPKYFKP